MACLQRWKRRLCILGLCLAFPLGINGCKESSQITEDVPTATILGFYPDISDYANHWINSELKFLVFLPLATVNERGEVEGVLAQSWEHSDDYRTWTIHLRDDVFWQDGVPFTAYDVEFTIDLLKRPELIGRYDWYSFYFVDLTVHDERTFTITYNQVPFYSLYWMPDTNTVFYPKHLLEDLDPADFSQWEFWKKPMGNGPYRVMRYVPATGIVFEANPDYFRDKPKIERVIKRYGNIQDLLAEQGDAIDFAVESDAQFLLKDDRFEFYYDYSIDMRWMCVILWNQKHPALSDPRVRRAFTLAIDRTMLPHIKVSPPDARIVDVPYTDRQFWQGDLPEPLPFDPEEATRLLEEAGWRDVDGDGIRELSSGQIGSDDRTELAFSLLTTEERGAVFIQSQLQRIGAKVSIITADDGVVFERMKAGNFDAVDYGIVTEPLGQMGLLHFFGHDSPAGYINPEVIFLLERALEESHPDRIDTIYKELAPIFLRDLPYTFLGVGYETYVVHRRLKGMSTPFRANPNWCIEHLWIEEGK